MIQKKFNNNDYLFLCPKCGSFGHIDKDQAEGKVSIICSNMACGYHETKNWLEGWENPDQRNKRGK